MVNIVSYAYPAGASGDIEIRYNLPEEKKFVIEIIDWGTPFSPFSVPEPDTGAALSVGELVYGVERSQRKASNRTRLNVLLTVVPPIPITRGVWELYGHTKAELSKIGKSIPDIDLLIASTARNTTTWC